MTTIHFLGPRGALERFPDRTELNRLASSKEWIHMDSFIYAAWEATKRLWVLDLHFCEFGYQGVLEVLEGARVRDVRIFSEPVKDKQKRHAIIEATIHATWNRGMPVGKAERAPVTVRWWDRLVRNPPAYPYPHDRFVVVDDSLWHFGFSACGSGNCLSAASGPWSVEKTEAISFFEELSRD